MYDDLVKRLRLISKSHGEFIDLYGEAADAIEKFIVYVQQIEELRKDGYYLQKIEMTDYGHAIMTRPLPEPPKVEPEPPKVEKELRIGDEVTAATGKKGVVKGVVVDCHVPNLDGEDKYTVVFSILIVECSRHILAKTGKQYATFTEYLREARNV